MSKITPKFNAKVIDNQLEFLNPDSLTGYLSTMPVNVQVVIKEISQRNPRSNAQNRYYWGVIIPLVIETTGYTKNECHEVLKTMFLSTHITFGKQQYSIPKSTTDLTTVEAEEYFEQIRGFASLELKCVIPSPREVEC